MRVLRGFGVAGLLACLIVAGFRTAVSQERRAPGDRPPVQQQDNDHVPESTTMAVIATSLVGLFLAGLQKRRKH